MDFTKFISLLESRALFFSRADRLIDTWEGAYTVENLRRRHTFLNRANALPGAMHGLSEFNRALRLHTFVSCWHLNDAESAAMWKLYVSQNEGIAIQTTFERLVSSFPSGESEMFEVYVGKVTYLDYEREVFPDGNTFVPFLHKRLSFEHEHELRAIIQPAFPGGYPLTETEASVDGLLVDVDVETLIQTVYIAPTSEAWFTKLVDDMVKRYGFRFTVRHSDLLRDPLY